jgi:hypothetical protein
MIVKIPGTRHGRHFYPQISGIASSFNPFAWNEYIDPRAGVVRLVFGLGTRFNDRSGDDFSRVVALNAPYRRPETDFEEICNYSQRKMDYIDLDNHRLESGYFVDIAKDATDIPVRLFITEGASFHPIMGTRPVALTFDIVLAETEFISTLRWILGALENSFGRVVEIEFGADFTQDRKFTITITSCRTLQEAPPAQINPQHIVLNAQGAVVGQSRTLSLDHIVYVTSHYGQLPLRERYEIARLVGRISKALAGRSLLLGPGRWCTTSPELGIPGSFAEINRVSAICEIVAMRDNLVPDVSMGAHIFNELVATGMLYFALFPGRKENIVNDDFLDKAPNRLTTLAPEASSWNPVLKVIELKRAILRADVLKQEVTGWISSSNDGIMN